MQEMAKAAYPGGSLLAALLGPQAAVDLRRAVQRLRAEGAPAVAVEPDIAGLATGLGGAEIARSPAVLEALPPLFWVEAVREAPGGASRIEGWVLEKKPAGLAARGFSIADNPTAEPERGDSLTLPFTEGRQPEPAETGYLRGLVTAIGLPEMLAQMGESSPVLLLPATPPLAEASLLRGLRLSVALSPDAAPQ